MKRNKILCLGLALLLLLSCIAGCSAKDASMEMEAPRESAASRNPVYGGMSTEDKSSTTNGSTPASGAVQNQKLIRTMDLSVETDDLDTLLAALDAKIKSLGGYVENKSVRNGSSSSTRSYRYANLTIRIPVQELDAFVDHVSGETNVISYSEQAEDITLSYVATQSRITALETEQARLLELLSKAENMTDLLQIEARLTDVRTELEDVTSRLRLYDNLVDYGTVSLSVTEVQEFTPTEEETLWQRLGNGLKNSWDGLCFILTELFVFLVTSIPYLLPPGILVTVLVLLGKRRKARRAKKAEQDKQQKAE